MTKTNPIASREQWLQARLRLLEKEKQLTRLRDELSAERRALPWLRVDRSYTFAGPDGPRTLPELFGGHGQLLVYHFMFAPDWDAGCRGCSFWADGFDRMVPHLAARDVQLVAISRGPLAKLRAYASRLGWTFPWYSSGDGDFNYDFEVSFRAADVARGAARYNYAPFSGDGTDRPGVSVFARDERGAVYHTYGAFARGIDAFNPAYQYLDLVPKGRDEAGLPMPASWWRRRDERVAG